MKILENPRSGKILESYGKATAPGKLRANPGKSGKIWENPGKSGKAPEKALGKTPGRAPGQNPGKLWDSAGKNRESAGKSGKSDLI